MKDKLVAKNLTKSFGQVAAVKELNLEVAKGTFITFLGPSGCGKTTTIRLIAGLEEPTEGELFIDGKLMSGKSSIVPPEKRNMGMVFQSYAIWPHLNVFENVAFPLKMKKWPNARINKRVQEMLSLVGLEGLGERRSTQLSGGQQQRVALARAIAPEPSILLLDEPLSNLDSKLRESMRFELRSLQKKVGITAVYVTHSQDEALTMSDLIVVMKDGKVQQVGTPLEIYHEPKNKFVAGFIGIANFLKGEKLDDLQGYENYKLSNGCVISAKNEKINPGKVGQNSEIVVRPENIVLRNKDVNQDELPSGMNLLEGKIRGKSFSGNLVEYLVAVPGLPATIRVQSNPSLIFYLDQDIEILFSRNESYVLPQEEEAIA